LASGATSAAESNDPDVKISNFKFDPASLEIPSGGTVTWTNRDDQPHTVTSAHKIFASPPLDTDDHFSFTFPKSGEYDYYCTIHPRMTGKVVVK
jgi:amicyanin